MSEQSGKKDYQSIYEDYTKRRERILQMGGEKAVEKQHAVNKLTARERMEYFFDNGEYTEIGPFVGHRTTAFGLGDKHIAAEGVVVGSALVAAMEDAVRQGLDPVAAAAAQVRTLAAAVRPP